MRNCWLLILTFLVVLTISSCGQAGPSLDPERSKVWHWPLDETQQEITTTKTAGQGDRVWTEQHGRALLKWPDLWVRLYDDTQLRLEECGVATDICLAMGMGTALNGGVSSVDERITWSTNHAQIILAGTTVMVAYHPQTQSTIVRVFDGVVEVRNLTGDVQTVPVASREWALVEPGQPPQVSDQLDEMRGLAQELGLWDVFHEVELDVEGSFGPAGSHVPAEDVDIVFVEEQPEVDSDSDGLMDAQESELGTDPNDPDTDADDLLDGREANMCTDPLNPDSDGDGHSDGEELAAGTDPCDPDDPPSVEGDDDGDGLTNGQELELGTDPLNPDTDADDLLDGREVNILGTDPLHFDSDADLLPDGREVNDLHTDPLNPDSDEDGLQDGREANMCTDPLNPDSDSDGYSDGEEVAAGTDPCDPDDPPPVEGDDDGDGLTNGQELELGTDPLNPDTDADDLRDGVEVLSLGTDPLNPDTDDDGLQDGREANMCTDPLNPDSDDDGWGDGQEVTQGTDPCQPYVPEALPDLTVEILSIDNNEIVWGEQPWSWIHYRVCNAGDGDLPTGPVYLRIWSNGAPRSGYIQLSGPLAPDDCMGGQFAVGHDNGWPEGEYAVQVEVDYRELIEEGDESNNVSRSVHFLVMSPEPEPTDRIVFVSERTGEPQIWIMDADGSNQVQLTRQGRNEAPFWSPYRGQILFQSDRDGEWRIYTMAPDGTQQRVVDAPGECVSPAASVRGQLSYACSVDGNWELFVDGKRITYNDSDDRLYTWSPAGDRIAFEELKVGGEYRALMRVDAYGGEPLRLTDPAYHSWNVTWSPDARRLVFASDQEGGARIFTMGTDGTDWRALTAANRWSQLPVWSPDGRWIAFVSADRDEVWSLYRMDVNGDSEIQLSRHTHPYQFASWSPDSQRLAFAGDADGDFEIYIVNYDGTGLLQLTEDSSPDHSPHWVH